MLFGGQPRDGQKKTINENANQLFLEHNAVKVIEITKLVEQKRGGGVSVPVEAFEGRNLIFVDEGHKGSGGEVWRGYREALAETGFTFEYSATFGQALSAARRDPLTIEYGKSMIFDYSYFYFYSDGFGKDFRILNLREEVRETQTEMLLLGNLLSFYEQLCAFSEQNDEIRPYNLEKPLWLFVGLTVNAIYRRKRQRRSDVLTIIRFLHHVLENKDDWVIKGIESFLAGNSGLTTPEGLDVFAGRFEYLRQKKSSAESIYSDILKKVFHSETGGALHLCDIRARQDELALKVSGAEAYFGLIYIGDTASFKNLVRDDSSGIVLEDDTISGSLFNEINNADSKTNILIGARKFMEGWNSWRVSNMGLLNIGRSEGSLIIQLFGRGVRLRGKDFSLKRSAALDGNHPPQLKLLETLDIFAVRANYMSEFREYLEREGLDVEDTVEMSVPISINAEFLQRGLVVPRSIENRRHASDSALLLDIDTNINLTVDLSVKVHAIASGEGRFETEDAFGGKSGRIAIENLDLIDWDQVYLDLLTYKKHKELDNLVIGSKIPRKIMEEINYTLIADETVFNPSSFAERMLLQSAVSNILQNYVDCFYRGHCERWASENMVYKILDTDDPNLAFNAKLREDSIANYSAKIKKDELELITAIERIQSNPGQLSELVDAKIPHIYFDRHLYQPLLLKGEKMVANPSGLEDSEARFVSDLKEYLNGDGRDALAETELFLLRNLSRGKGVYFFKNSGFYPDFIMWLINKVGQRIIFIEPHGMMHATEYIYDEKAQLHERLAVISEGIKTRSEIKNVSLDAFIISSTPYETLRQHYGGGTWNRDKFTEKHILFFDRNEDYNYLRILVEGIQK